MAIAVAILATVYLAITYRDYTGIYANKMEDRSETKYIIYHHDGINHDTNIDAIQTQHRFANGWESGFAYHFYLKDGLVYQMRNLNANSPHAYGFNWNSVAICIHEEDKFQLRTRINTTVLVGFLMLKYKLDSSCIFGHGELPENNTSCPEMDMDSVRTNFELIKQFKIWER